MTIICRQGRHRKVKIGSRPDRCLEYRMTVTGLGFGARDSRARWVWFAAGLVQVMGVVGRFEVKHRVAQLPGRLQGAGQQERGDRKDSNRMGPRHGQ